MITILHHDQDLLVVSKPSGVIVHQGWGVTESSLVERLKAQTDAERLHVLHRLDRSTSGVIAFALNASAASTVSAAFRARAVRKQYLALVRGSFQFEGRLDYAIPKAPGEARVEAQTDLRCLAQAATSPRETSLVLAQPLTGRTHQIRRHLKHLNHPIIGDVNYGKGALNRAARSTYQLHRLALHAWQLELTHPSTGASLRFTAPLPGDLSEPLERMGYRLEELQLN